MNMLAATTRAQSKIRRSNQGNVFRRLLTARAVASARGRSAEQEAARLWPNDLMTMEVVERAATTPAMTSVTGWAAELVQRYVADALEVLSAASAGAELLRLGLVVAFDRPGVVMVPGFVTDANAAGFVAEGDPIPVHQFGLTPAQLDAHKIASISVLTREMIESSNAEALVGDALVRSAGLALDAVLFDTNPATAARPAGLRNGIATLPASNNADLTGAFYEDLAALLGAVSAVGGNGPFVLIASPARATLLYLRFIKEPANLVVLGSTAAGNLMIVVAPTALAAALGTDPLIETANAGTLHMDTAPVAVGTAGAHRSMFQTDSIAVKLRWPLSWALRDPRGVAWTTPTWK